MTRVVQGLAVRRLWRAAACAAPIAGATISAEPVTGRIDGRAADLLRRLHFTVADLDTLDRDEPVARVLPTDSREIAVVERSASTHHAFGSCDVFTQSTI